MNPLSFIPPTPMPPLGVDSAEVETEDNAQLMIEDLTVDAFASGMFNLINYILDNRELSKGDTNTYLRGGGGGATIDAILME